MTTQADTKKTYVLDGTLLEACSCGDHAPAGWATTQTVVVATRSMPTTLIGVK